MKVHLNKSFLPAHRDREITPFFARKKKNNRKSKTAIQHNPGFGSRRKFIFPERSTRVITVVTCSSCVFRDRRPRLRNLVDNRAILAPLERALIKPEISPYSCFNPYFPLVGFGSKDGNSPPSGISVRMEFVGTTKHLCTLWFRSNYLLTPEV